MQPDLDSKLRADLHAAISALWQDEPDVSVWNQFWMKHCVFRGQWLLPEDMNLNLPKGLGTSISGRNWTGINLTRGTIRARNFSNHILRNGAFYHADLRECDFINARLEGADFRGAHLGGANFTGANLTGANLTGARLKGAILTGANLKDADLRFAQDIEFDENAVEGAHFTSLVSRFATSPTEALPEDFFDWGEPIGTLDDHWSKLRRTYTGPRFALLLLLTIAFLLPHIIQVTMLATLGQVESDLMSFASRAAVEHLKSDPIQPGISAADQLESQIGDATREAVDTLESRWRALLITRRVARWEDLKQDMAREKSEVLTALNANLAARRAELRQRVSDAFAFNAATTLQKVVSEYESQRRYRVWQILFGFDKGSYAPVILAIILIAFNLLRMTVTLMVSSLREAEERSGVTPSRREYTFVYGLHKTVSVLWIVAISELIYTFWVWLKTPVVLF